MKYGQVTASNAVHLSRQISAKISPWERIQDNAKELPKVNFDSDRGRS